MRIALLTSEYPVMDDQKRIARLDLSYAITPKSGARAFHFSRLLFRDFLLMLGVPETRIEERGFYEGSTVRRLLLRVDTRSFPQDRFSHAFLKPLGHIQ
jgi:hypothetical protein